MKKVLNTVVGKSTGSTPLPSGDLFIYWGHIDKTTSITAPEILALQYREERADRLKTFTNFDSGGEHMIVVQPVSYGGQGKFLDTQTGFTYPFDLSGVVQITDSNNNTYDVNVWVWSRTSHGTISELKTL